MGTSLSVRGKLLQILVAFVFSVGLIFPTGTVVLAEDTVPPATQEETAPSDPVAPEEPAAPADPVPPVEEPVVEPSVEPPAEVVPADPTVEAPVVDPTSDPLVTEVPVVVDTPEGETSVPETVAAEIIQVADENGVTLADSSGEPLTMATNEAVELLSSGDPFFWSSTLSRWEGYTVSGSGCPTNVTCHAAPNPFQAAISAAPAGATIYVAAGSYTEDLIINTANLSFRGYSSISVQSNGNVQNITNGTATANKITLNVDFNTTSNVYSGNIFINTGATLVDALALLSPGGGLIELGAGTFIPDKNQTISKSVEIRGNGTSGAGMTTLLAATGSGYSNMLVINASGININNLVLDGKNDSDGTSLDADVAISDTNNFDGLVVWNTIIKNFNTRGILIGEDTCGGGSCDNNTYYIHDNTIQNIRGASGGSGSETDGIGIQILNDTGSTNRTIEKNTITNTDIGIDFRDSQLNITGNTLNGNTYGIRGEDSSANITNNNIYSNNYGFYVNGLSNGDAIVANLNRFFNNSSYGLYFYNAQNNDPIINAESNWWGCNLGVTNANCDKVYTANNKIDSNPWLMLGLTANPTSIFTGETSTLTAFMYRSNDNTNKTPVTGLSWFVLPEVKLTGSNFGLLSNNIFTAGGLSGVQNFYTEFDNIKKSLNTDVKATVQVKGDTDGDKIENGIDNCPGVANPTQADTDLDGTGNACDSTPNGDTDNDGIDNLADNCPTVSNADQADNDNDGSGNACDSTPNGDTDNDGIDNLADNCPTVSNADQADTDNDGSGNACDSTPNGDTDSDGIDNLADNCPAVSNADQADTDNDGSGNACDSTPNGDTDGDGVDNLADNCPAVSNADQADTDNDGSGNACDSTPNGDTDSDGIDNLADNCPTVSNADQADTDTDGTGNACDTTPNGDTDSDGIDNSTDNCPIIANPDQADKDGDGTGNACDSTPNGPSTYSPPTIVLPVGGLPFDAGIIPVTGGLNALSCSVANTLALPNGDKVVFSDILCEFEAALTQEFSETLLSPLPAGLKFVDGLNLEVQKNATLFNVLPQPVTNTISFMVPDAFKGKSLKILFWDTTLKNGMGDWVEIPSKLMANGEVVSAPLAKGDQRLVVSGVELTSLPTTETTLNFTGLFILAAE